MNFLRKAAPAEVPPSSCSSTGPFDGLLDHPILQPYAIYYNQKTLQAAGIVIFVTFCVYIISKSIRKRKRASYLREATKRAREIRDNKGKGG
jgi:hypothetical protein